MLCRSHLQASAELQELCRLQLQLLTAALQLSLQAVVAGGVAGSAGSLDEDCPVQHLELESTALRSTVYCRAPASLQTGQLQLQLVADTDGGGGGGASSARAQQAQRFLFLGEDRGAGASLADQERWIVEQSVIVLPDSGGLVLPLASNGFLVGLLVVERCSEEGEAAPAAANAAEEGAVLAAAGAAAGQGVGGAAAGAGGAADAAGAAGSGGGGSRGAMPPPPACLLFRSSELQLIKQTAAVLALACAMDLRAALERAGAAYRQRQASALVQEVSASTTSHTVRSWQPSLRASGILACASLSLPASSGRALIAVLLAGLPASKPRSTSGTHPPVLLTLVSSSRLLLLCWAKWRKTAGPRTTTLTPHPTPRTQARKPLSVMRTLGTMLLPRLQPGEPDRDFAQGAPVRAWSHENTSQSIFLKSSLTQALQTAQSWKGRLTGLLARRLHGLKTPPEPSRCTAPRSSRLQAFWSRALGCKRLCRSCRLLCTQQRWQRQCRPCCSRRWASPAAPRRACPPAQAATVAAWAAGSGSWRSSLGLHCPAAALAVIISGAVADWPALPLISAWMQKSQALHQTATAQAAAMAAEYQRQRQVQLLPAQAA